MPRLISSGDPWAWREEARSIVTSHSLAVDPSSVTFLGDPGQYFVFNPAKQKWYSKYGIMNSIMELPPTLLEVVHGKLLPHAAPNVLIFNLYNLLLCLLTALVLLKITARYTSRNWLRIAYVLACMYATYLWFYQRAQSSEIFQVLFFALGFWFLIESTSNRAPRTLWLVWLFWGALIFTRLVFVILIPAIWITTAFAGRRSKNPSPLRTELARLIVPPVLIFLLLACINWIKFGSPFLTGYHQWHADQHRVTLNWEDGVYGFLFSTRWSIFLYFPVLIFALPAIRRFAAEYPIDSVALFSAFLISLFIIGSIPTWRGEWTYGPRYMIFCLPILALPALLFFDRLLANPPAIWQCWTIASLVALVLGCSLYQQWEVNKLDFWTVHRLAGPFENGGMDLEVYRYFNDHMEGTIIADLERHKKDLQNSQLLQQLSRTLTPESADQYKEAVAKMLKETNFYWLPPPKDQADRSDPKSQNGV